MLYGTWIDEDMLEGADVFDCPEVYECTYEDEVDPWDGDVDGLMALVEIAEELEWEVI